jgi:phage tail-like protein
MAETLTHKLIITGPDQKEKIFKVPLGVTTIGRQVGVDLQLDSPQVSRRHARLVCTKVECEISDQGSSNGTYVNGEKLTPKAPVILASGNMVKIGPFELTYQLEAIEIPAAKPKLEEKPPPAKPEIELKEAADAAPQPAEAIQTPDKVTADLKEEGKEEPPPPPRKKTPTSRRKKAAAPPPPPAEPPPSLIAAEPRPEFSFPPGLDRYSQQLINFLPGIYHTDFMSRFLGMFEAILKPIEWNVDNFDLYLDPGTAPASFLPWLANWFALTTNSTWSEDQRRALLKDAHAIFARRGTRWALARVLEIYTGQAPEIIDNEENLEAHTFKVRLPVRKREINPDLVEALIDAHKPAHTLYEVSYKR